MLADFVDRNCWAEILVGTSVAEEAVTYLQVNVGSGFASLRQANAFGEKGSRDSMDEGWGRGMAIENQRGEGGEENL